ncbi:MAG: MoaD/ThiS family protein [Chloroflexi bacterium]|nr:MoaD/ThiS family protein [Chloroflexota bacterium]
MAILRLHGHLNWYIPGHPHQVEIPLAHPTPLVQVLQRLGIPLAEIMLIADAQGTVKVFEDHLLHPNDTIELLPPIGGGS